MSLIIKRERAKNSLFFNHITDTAKPITIPDDHLKEWFIFGYILSGSYKVIIKFLFNEIRVKKN